MSKLGSHFALKMQGAGSRWEKSILDPRHAHLMVHVQVVFSPQQQGKQRLWLLESSQLGASMCSREELAFFMDFFCFVWGFLHLLASCYKASSALGLASTVEPWQFLRCCLQSSCTILGSHTQCDKCLLWGSQFLSNSSTVPALRPAAAVLHGHSQDSPQHLHSTS